jgi:hypothetical protein
MGFSEALGRPGCPRVARGHGLKRTGSEHMHIAVSLVSEDGSIASNWRDRVTMSKACGNFERDYGLAVVDGRNRGPAPGVSRAEDELAARRGRPEAERETLVRQVRAASVASKDEAEFVHRLWAEGVHQPTAVRQGRPVNSTTTGSRRRSPTPPTSRPVSPRTISRSRPRPRRASTRCGPNRAGRPARNATTSQSSAPTPQVRLAMSGRNTRHRATWNPRNRYFRAGSG